MNALETPQVSVTPAEASANATLPRLPRWRRFVSIPWKLATGALLTQTLLGAVLVFGWLQRWTQRTVFKAWWRRASVGGSFAQFASSEPWIHDYRHAPNWLLEQNFLTPSRSGQALPIRLVRSAIANAKLGVAGLVNVMALTMPGLTLVALGWWGGWQNSFHKGYEEFSVGPVVSLLGIFLFIAAMFYVPMALTRQAVTGRLREFWRWRIVWTLTKHAWLGCAALALAFAVLNIGTMWLKTWPTFVPQARMAERIKEAIGRGSSPASAAVEAFEARPGEPNWNELEPKDALAYLKRHYLRSGFYLFGSLLILRWLAARIYASAVLRSVERSALAEDQLSEVEWRLLQTLRLWPAHRGRPRHLLVRAAAWTAARSSRLICAGVVFVLWFVFVGEVYVSEFLNHHPWIGILNQPLIQLPWFRYVPIQLQNPASEVALTILSLGVLGLIGWARRRYRKRQSA